MSEALAKKLRLNIGQEITILNCTQKEYFSEFKVSEDIPQDSVDIIKRLIS